MDEYIKREALREILDGWRDAHADVDDVHGCGLLEDVICEVDAQTAADVALVVHGCFEPCFDENGNWRQGFAKCSNCGKEYYAQVINHFGYCPNCGAKMDGGADRETD